VVRQRDVAHDPTAAWDALPRARRVLARPAALADEPVPSEVEVIVVVDDDRALLAARARRSASELVVVLDERECLSSELAAALDRVAESGAPGAYAAAVRIRFLGRDVASGATTLAWLGAPSPGRPSARLAGALHSDAGSVAATIDCLEARAWRAAERARPVTVADFVGRPLAGLARRVWERRREGVPGMILSVVETYGDVLVAAQTWERHGVGARRAAIRRGVPPGFHIWLTPHGWLALRDGTRSALRETLLDATPAAVAAAPLAGGRGGVWTLPLGDGSNGVLRWYRRGGALRRILRDRYFGRPTRPMLELTVTEAIRQRGVPTVEVLAARVDRLRLGWYRGALVTRALDGARTLAAALAERPPGAEREALVGAVGRAVRDLHDRAVHHRDLNATNILMGAGGPEPRVFFIDFDRAAIGLRIGPWTRRRALRRLERSLVKLGAGTVPWTASDGALLRRSYEAASANAAHRGRPAT